MLKRILLAVVILSFSATGAIAQDVFVSFGDQTQAPVTTAEGVAGTTGTGFILVQGFAFDGFQVDLVSTDTSVATIASGTVLNSDFTTVGQTRFNNADVDLNSNGVLDPNGVNGSAPESGDINSIAAAISAAGATFQATSINQRGLGSPGFDTFDQGFDAATSQFQIATFEYDVLAGGSTTFELRTTGDDVFAGPTGFLTIPEGVELSPVFGSASLTVEGDGPAGVPEPSTMGLLALGLVGFVARRRR